jgi:Right handed beta helix region/Periplasmic copper-binding protein (NosD)
MDRQAVFPVIVLAIASAVMFILGSPPTAQETAHDCPAPTVMRGSQCVLEGDVVLDATLTIDSFTHLNCQGHKILPSSTSDTGFVRSAPEVAIFLNGAYGSKIQNCIIGDATQPFDFGIWISKSKIPPDQADDPEAVALRGNKVLNNEMRTRSNGVQLLESDSTHISGNTFESIGGCSIGIAVGWDSDSNLITDNTLIGSTGTSGGPMRAFPGTDDPIVLCFDTSIFLAGALVDFPLINARVGNELIQIRNAPNIGLTGQTELSSDGNVIDSNSTMQVGSSAGKDAHGGILLARDATDTLIANNMVSGGLRGIDGRGITTTITIPGTCTLDSSRYCLSDADCFISDVDTTPKGTCTGVTTIPNVHRTSRGTRIEHNQLTGSFNDRAITVMRQIDSSIIGNTIAATAPFGISASSEFIQTGIVKNNIIDGPSTGLRLQKGAGIVCSPADCFRAQISQNDFINNQLKIGLFPTGGQAYDLATELSVDGKGNYWGLSCEQSGGFDPTQVSPANPNVKDSHPYGVPVAETPDSLLPAPCN